MQTNSPDKQQFKTATGWRHWPLIEQFVELKSKVALGEASRLGLLVFAVVLFASSWAILRFDIKEFSDFASIFVLYLATLMLALQPEGTPGENSSSLRAKQKRHLRIALGFVAFGAMMQMASFHLNSTHSKEETERRVSIDRSISQIELATRLAEKRLHFLEEANAAQAKDLTETKSEIQTIKSYTEHSPVKQSTGSVAVSPGMHDK